jgi:diaminopimelate epimerase
LKLEFTKMHGLGNDFIVIDGIRRTVDLSLDQLQFLANRNFGVGCDQILLVERPRSSNADFRYRIFNPDGSEVSQCGNGARCFARFVLNKKLTSKPEITVDTNAGQLVLQVRENDDIQVNMGIPRHEPDEIPLKAATRSMHYETRLGDQDITFGAVSLGNPHAVILVDKVRTAPVEQLGRQLESHEIFPQQVNSGFMEVIDRHRARLRVFERGAGETLACGSGACAATVVGIEQQLLENPVRIDLPGGPLMISWGGYGQPVYMTGPAISVFEGRIEL